MLFYKLLNWLLSIDYSNSTFNNKVELYNKSELPLYYIWNKVEITRDDFVNFYTNSLSIYKVVCFPMYNILNRTFNIHS